MSPVEEVVIDLSGTRGKGDVIRALGGAFEFGGPSATDNVAASGIDDSHRGYGQNWDAVIDCFRDLDNGGIWGTSRRFQFPLLVIFKNWAHLESLDGNALSDLKEVLSIASSESAEGQKEFRFEFR